MRTSPKALDLLKELEGFGAQAYQDVGGVWTIGYGRIQGVKAGDTATENTAAMWLADDLIVYEQAVLDACTLAPTRNQFDAMVLLCYNIGWGAFRRSTVRKAHNRGDFTAAAKAFGLWNKVKGRVVPGLVRRRAIEASLYLKPEPTLVETAVLPVGEPDAEKPMTRSTINLAGSVAGIVATGTGVQQTMAVINSVKQEANNLDAWLVPSLIFLVAGMCAYIVWERFQQRKRGDA